MMASTENRLRNVKVALELVKDKPVRFTELLAQLTKVTGSGSRSYSIILLSLKLGYLDKPNRGVYRITGQGIKMLEAMRNSQEGKKK